MKITKFSQACLLVETDGKRILIDPGTIGYTDEMLEKHWTNIDVILVTHKHADHCITDVVNEIVKRDNAKLYTNSEVISTYNFVNVNKVAEGDIFNIDNIKIKVVKAVHGFLTPMKQTGSEIKENVGYIVDNGNTRLYVTSDTINFNHDYKCDVLAMPFNGNGLTLGLVDGVEFIKDINPKLVLPIHLQHPKPIMNPDINVLKQTLEKENINYKILDILESIEV